MLKTSYYYTGESISGAFICDLGYSQSRASEQKSDIQVVTPFIAPEVFNTRKCTPKSDIYAFGIIMHLVANGKIPFGNRLFDSDLVRDIRDGLRPAMPESAPEAYKKLAERCCDAHPDKRPEDVRTYIRNLFIEIDEMYKGKSDANVWDGIYIR